MDNQFDAIDAALEAAKQAIDRKDKPTALAGLFGAVAGINALAAPVPMAVVVPSGPVRISGGLSSLEPNLRGNREGVDPNKLQERIGNVLGSVQKIVDKFGPDSYTVSAGFPLGVNVSLTWNSKGGPDPA